MFSASLRLSARASSTLSERGRRRAPSKGRLRRALDRTMNWAGEMAALLGRSVGHSYETYQGRGPEMRSPLLAHRGPVRVRALLGPVTRTLPCLGPGHAHSVTGR